MAPPRLSITQSTYPMGSRSLRNMHAHVASSCILPEMLRRHCAADSLSYPMATGLSARLPSPAHETILRCCHGASERAKICAFIPENGWVHNANRIK
eukprot:706871-Lingulodinium_polyedra.AAC.2